MNKKIVLAIISVLVMMLSYNAFADSNENDSGYLTKGQILLNDEFDMSLKIIEIGNDKTGNYADIEIFYSDRDTYDAPVTGGNNGYVPNPSNYPGIYGKDLLNYATTLYRTHYNCDGTLKKEVWREGRAIVNLSEGYKNYVCRSRQQEQCYIDGSFDSYYDERCDFGTVRFYENESKSTTDFEVRTGIIQDDKVEVSINPIEQTNANKPTHLPPSANNKEDNQRKLSDEDYNRLMEAIKIIKEIYAKLMLG